MSKSRSFICKPDVLGQILTTTCSAFSKVSQSTCRLEAVTEPASKAYADLYNFTVRSFILSEPNRDKRLTC
jgi:hypothetical protein